MKRLDSHTCQEWEEKLIAGHLNDLSPAGHLAFKAHLRSCAACTAAYADYLTVGALLDNLPLLEPTRFLSPELLLASDERRAFHPVSLWREKLPRLQLLYGLLVGLATPFNTAYNYVLGSISYRLRVSRRLASALAVAYVMLAALIAGGIAGIMQTISGQYTPVQPASQPLSELYPITVSPWYVPLGQVSQDRPQQAQFTISNDGSYSLNFKVQTQVLFELGDSIELDDSTFGGLVVKPAVFGDETPSTVYRSDLSAWIDAVYVDLTPPSGTIPPGSSTPVTVRAGVMTPTPASASNYSFYRESDTSYFFQIGVQSNGGNQSVYGSFSTGQHSSCVDTNHPPVRTHGTAQLIPQCQKNSATYLDGGGQLSPELYNGLKRSFLRRFSFAKPRFQLRR